ncbi:MAG: hypothetical protein RBS99_12065 [Rhodospirillales bacterium]|jgi:hypothetical protein|nr:hypothetical protein [Rhodospirillales bacterium]
MTVWTLVFSDPEPMGDNPTRRVRALYWLLRRLKPGFRHVMAMRPADGGGWIIANWSSGRFDVIEHDGPVDIGGERFGDYGDFIAALEDDGLATTCTREARDGKTPFLRGPATCVTAAKHLLGIRAPLAVTPWRLYRHLTGGT